MMKVTVMYGHPKSVDDFEKYYKATHLPIAAKMRGVTRLELTRFGPGPDGTKPAFYRMAEVFFPNPTQMQQTLQSPEGQATVADLPRFATGGVTVMIGTVES